MSLRLIVMLLFGSGFSALVYQTAWQRMFRLIFGASTLASAAVLPIFLGGLGLATVVNAIVGLVARREGMRAPPIGPAPQSEAQPPSAAPPISKRLIYGAAAATGLVFLQLELVWYRMLGPILGGTSFTFGLI